MSYQIFSLVIGFIIWLLATILFRFAGQYFFLTDVPAALIGLYLIVIPILGLVTTYVFNRYKLDKPASAQSAAMMVLPGMILDSFCIEFFAFVFPNLPEKDGATFGSWLMWAYATVLFFSLIRNKRAPKTHSNSEFGRETDKCS